MPRGISTKTDLELRKTLLTPRQRRASRQLWPEFEKQPAGRKAKTRTLRQATAPPPPVSPFSLFGKRILINRKVIGEAVARRILRSRRQVERQNRRRGRSRR